MKVSNEVLISKMVGREISQIYPKQEVERGEEIFRVEGLSKTGVLQRCFFFTSQGRNPCYDRTCRCRDEQKYVKVLWVLKDPIKERSFWKEKHFQ